MYIVCAVAIVFRGLPYQLQMRMPAWASSNRRVLPGLASTLQSSSVDPFTPTLQRQPTDNPVIASNTNASEGHSQSTPCPNSINKPARLLPEPLFPVHAELAALFRRHVLDLNGRKVGSVQLDVAVVGFGLVTRAAGGAVLIVLHRRLSFQRCSI